MGSIHWVTFPYFKNLIFHFFTFSLFGIPQILHWDSYTITTFSTTNYISHILFPVFGPNQKIPVFSLNFYHRHYLYFPKLSCIWTQHKKLGNLCTRRGNLEFVMQLFTSRKNHYFQNLHIFLDFSNS